MAMTAFRRDNPHLQAGGGRLPRNPGLFILLTLVGFNVMFLGASLTGGLAAGIVSLAVTEVFGLAPQQAQQAMMAAYLVLFFGAIYPLAWLWLRLAERRSFASIGFLPRRGAVKFATGFAVGAGSIALAIGLMAAFGVIRPDPDRDAASVGAGVLLTVLLIAVAWTIQGTAEEVLTRGYLLQNLGKRTPLIVAVLVQALVFGVLHLANDGVTLVSVLNLLLVGVVLALWALWEGGIWGVSGWHAAWNWAQGNVFGFPVSGNAPPGGSLLALQADGPDLLAGGTFGPEGSIATTIVLVLLGILFLVLGRRGMQA